VVALCVVERPLGKGRASAIGRVECSLALLYAFVDSETRERPAPPSTTSGPNRSLRQRVSLPANEHNVARAPGGEQGRGGASAAPPGNLASRHQAIETASAQRRMQLRIDEYSRPCSWSHGWSKCGRTWIFKNGRSAVSRSSIIASRR
jgi:hypothetical protein